MNHKVLFSEGEGVVDIDKIIPEIVEYLRPLRPDKIILFGSYAYGKPNEESDIDLLLVKDIDKHKARDYLVEAQLRVRDLIAKYKVGFDFLVAGDAFLKNRKDFFYQKEILEKGKVLYE